ncbi:hypothetical protein GMSM_01980 [Geomonas sp. Red276]
MKKIIFLTVGLALIASQAMAASINFTSGLTQGEFKSLSKEAGGAISYKNVAPAEPLGLTGFDVGVEVSAIDIKTGGNNYWDRAFNGDAPSYLFIPKIRARKGLPFGIDLGASYAYVPDSNIKLYGAELSKAILEGSAITPALGIRATYTKLAGVKDLDLQTAGIDASISKGFFILTPYAGVGAVYVMSKATGDLQKYSPAVNGGAPLSSEKFWQPRGFAGVKISPFPLFGITAEVEYEVRPIYTLKAALSF